MVEERWFLFAGRSLTLQPNQSLKLTEPAVDDFAARNNRLAIVTGIAPRGLNSVAAAASLPQLSSGPLGRNGYHHNHHI